MREQARRVLAVNLRREGESADGMSTLMEWSRR